MKPEDKEAFEAAWKAHEEYVGSIIASNKHQAFDMWIRALAHRDAQPAVAVKCALCSDTGKHSEIFAGFPPEGYTPKMIDCGCQRKPAIAVNEQLLGALRQSKSEIWRLLDTKGIDSKAIKQWPEIVLIDAAIAAAEAAKGEQNAKT